MPKNTIVYRKIFFCLREKKDFFFCICWCNKATAMRYHAFRVTVGPTDRPTDGHSDKPSYRDARTYQSNWSFQKLGGFLRRCISEWKPRNVDFYFHFFFFCVCPRLRQRFLFISSRDEATNFGWLIGWLVNWLVGRLVGWPVGRLVGWSVGRLVGWLVGWQIDWLVRWSVCRA